MLGLVGGAAQQVDARGIAALPGLDCIYLGVYDYSVALGVPGQVDDPRVKAFVERATAIGREAGKAVGTTAMSALQVEFLRRVGVNVFLYGTDTWMLGNAVKAGLALYAGGKGGAA